MTFEKRSSVTYKSLTYVPDQRTSIGSASPGPEGWPGALHYLPKLPIEKDNRDFRTVTGTFTGSMPQYTTPIPAKAGFPPPQSPSAPSPTSGTFLPRDREHHLHIWAQCGRLDRSPTFRVARGRMPWLPPVRLQCPPSDFQDTVQMQWQQRAQAQHQREHQQEQDRAMLQLGGRDTAPEFVPSDAELCVMRQNERQRVAQAHPERLKSSGRVTQPPVVGRSENKRMVQIIAQDKAAAYRRPAGPAPGMAMGPQEQENDIRVESAGDAGFATVLVGEMSKGSRPFSKVEQMRVWDDLQVQGSMHRDEMCRARGLQLATPAHIGGTSRRSPALVALGTGMQT